MEVVVVHLEARGLDRISNKHFLFSFFLVRYFTLMVNTIVILVKVAGAMITIWCPG